MEDSDSNFLRRESVLSLTYSLIDYAGLFPPAKLDMATTVRNYAAYLEDPDAPMLARLIVPAARLDEFEKHAADRLSHSIEEDAWQLSALTAPAGDEQLEADLERIAAFNERHADPEAGLAMVDVIELKGGSADAIDAALDRITTNLYPFFELEVDTDPRGLIAALVGGDAGAKIRTGGVTADLYPSPPDVARFIAACAAADVPFKATAGLHHVLRRFSPEVDTDEFGFLNVFLAAVLAFTHEMPAADLVHVLEQRSIEALSFDPEGFGWGEHRVTVDEIEDTRLAFAVSFGSCSFDEPREELRQLDLL